MPVYRQAQRQAAVPADSGDRDQQPTRYCAILTPLSQQERDCRYPASGVQELMFSEGWLWFAVLLLLLGAVLGHSGLLLITLLVTIVTAMAWLWNRFVLGRIEYTRELAAHRVFAGENVSVSIVVTNHKTLPVPWMRVSDMFPASLLVIDRELQQSSAPGRAVLSHLLSLGPHERLRWDYELKCARRGFYFFGPVDFRSGDIFGLFSQKEQH